MNGMFRAYDMLVDHLAHIDEAIKQMGNADDGFLRVIKDLRNKQKKEHAKLMDSLIWHWQRKNCEWYLDVYQTAWMESWDTAALAMEEEITKHLIYGDMGEKEEGER